MKLKHCLILSCLLFTAILFAAQLHNKLIKNNGNQPEWLINGTGDDTSEVIFNMGWSDKVGKAQAITLYRTLRPNTTFTADTMVCNVYWQASPDGQKWVYVDTMNFTTGVTPADTLIAYRNLRMVIAEAYRLVVDGQTGNDTTNATWTIVAREEQ